MSESCSRRTASSCGVICSFELFLGSSDIPLLGRDLQPRRLVEGSDSVGAEDHNFKLMEARSFRVDSRVQNGTLAEWADESESAWCGGNGGRSS